MESQYNIPKCEFLMAVIGREGEDYLVVGSRKVNFLQLELKRDFDDFLRLDFLSSYMTSYIAFEGKLETMVYVKAKTIKKGFKELSRIFAEEEAEEQHQAEARQLELESIRARRLADGWSDDDYEDWYDCAEEY